MLILCLSTVNLIFPVMCYMYSLWLNIPGTLEKDLINGSTGLMALLLFTVHLF